MSRSLPLDFLIVSTLHAVHLSELVEKLNELRVGVVDVTPPPASAETTPRPGLERVGMGRLAIHETLGRIDVTLVFERHLQPVMSGLAPAALNRLTAGLDERWKAVMGAGTLSVDIRALVGDPDRLWCLRWLMGLLERVASFADGALFDPAAQRCLSPEVLGRTRQSGPVGQIALHSENWGPELRWLHTHGLQKFGQPELEMVRVPQPLEAEATSVLRTVAETLATADSTDGPSLRPGMQIDCEGAGWLVACTTQTDADHGAPFGRLRLVTSPSPGQAPGDDATEVIATSALATAQSAIDSRAWPIALRYIDQVLAALPDHPAALTAKGRYFMAHGEPHEALNAGSYLRLRAPKDRRGYYITGLAMAALGRPVEALDVLTQAIALDPDDPDLFDARARVDERLGRNAMLPPTVPAPQCCAGEVMT